MSEANLSRQNFYIFFKDYKIFFFLKKIENFQQESQIFLFLIRLRAYFPQMNLNWRFSLNLDLSWVLNKTWKDHREQSILTRTEMVSGFLYLIT